MLLGHKTTTNKNNKKVWGCRPQYRFCIPGDILNSSSVDRVCPGPGDREDLGDRGDRGHQEVPQAAIKLVTQDAGINLGGRPCDQFYQSYTDHWHILLLIHRAFTLHVAKSVKGNGGWLYRMYFKDNIAKSCLYNNRMCYLIPMARVRTSPNSIN